MRFKLVRKQLAIKIKKGMRETKAASIKRIRLVVCFLLLIRTSFFIGTSSMDDGETFDQEMFWKEKTRGKNEQKMRLIYLGPKNEGLDVKEKCTPLRVKIIRRAVSVLVMAAIILNCSGSSSMDPATRSNEHSFTEDLTRFGIESNPGPKTVLETETLYHAVDVDEKSIENMTYVPPVSSDNEPYPSVSIIPSVTVRFRPVSDGLDYWGQPIKRYNVTVDLDNKDFMRGSSNTSLATEGKFAQEMTIHEIARARHNFVCLALTSADSDIAFKQFFKDDPQQNKTPDFIFKKNNTIFVVEVTTAGTELEHQSAWLKKENAYGPAMENRSQNIIDPGCDRVIYHILVASTNSVRTSLKLTPEELISIKNHYSIGSIIHRKALNEGIISMDEEDSLRRTVSENLAKATKRASDNMRLPVRDDESRGFITKVMVESWENDPVSGSSFKLRVKHLTDNLIKTGYKMMSQYTDNSAERSIKTAEKRVEAYLKECSEVKVIRGLDVGATNFQDLKKMKSVCVLPLLFPKQDQEEWTESGVAKQDETVNLVLDGELPYFPDEQISAAQDVWNTAVDHMIASKFGSASLDELEGLSSMSIEKYLERDQLGRRQRARVSINMAESVRRELALDGVLGKSFDKDPYKFDKLEQTRKPFSFEHDVSDIDDFIKNEIPGLNLFDESTNGWNSLHETIDREEGKDDKSVNILRQLLKTKLCVSLSIISNIVEEVNSSFRQFCSKDEFIIKRLRAAPVFLLIKPTSPDNHMFFSIAWKSTAFDHYSSSNVFRQRSTEYHSNGWTCTDFVSMNRHKVHSWIGCHLKAASFITLFCELSSQPFETLVEQLKNKDPEVYNISQHSLTMILALFEGKTETAAMLQNIRYAYTELTRAKDLFVDPLKILSKFSILPRSRFYIWAVYSFCQSMMAMCKDRPFLIARKEADAENKNGDNFGNLVSWVSQAPIKTFAEAVNLSYFGIVRNKDDSVKIHGLYKIFQKVIKEELNLHKANDDYMGYFDRESLTDLNVGDGLQSQYKSHEFSPTWMRYSGHIAKQYIQRTNCVTDSEWKTFLNEEFGSMARHMSAEKYATFKASAVVSSDEEFVPHKKDDPSIRTLEAVYNRLKSNGSYIPLTDIDELITILEDRGGVYAALFRKPQNTGDREIFILDFISRIVINYLETLSRTIGKHLPTEMMTKGNLKYKRTGIHMATVNAAYRSMTSGDTEIEIITATDSDDASTWSQGFVMPAFAAFFKEILPEEEFKVSCRILNMVANKKLRLPNELLTQFYSKPDVLSTNEGMNELKSQFLGRSPDSTLVNKLRSSMINISNMMQGILHYSSSIMHSAHLMMLEGVNQQVFKNWLAKKDTDQGRLVISSDVSSDDSAVMRTILIEPRFRPESRKLLILFSSIKRASYPLMCASQSYEKATPSCFGTKEFNSIWNVYNTIISPKIKFVVACLNLSIDGSLDQRQITYSNLRRQILENGGSQFLAAFVQECQRILHYTAIGLNMHKLFRRYYTLLRQTPCMSLGWFVREPEHLCGVFGSSFADYLLLKSDVRARKAMNAVLMYGDAEINSEGKPTLDFFMLFGNSKRYKEFKEKVLGTTIQDDWRTEPYKAGNYQVYFRDPRNVEECIFKIKEKIFSNGARDNFAFKTGSMMLASATYCIHSPCIKVIVRRPDADGKQVKEETKMSLLECVKWMTDLANIVPDLSMEMMDLLYRNSGTYDLAFSIMRNTAMNNSRIVHTGFRAERFITFFSQSELRTAPRSLLKTVQQKWASMRVMTDLEEQICWERYTKAIPWLKETFEKTVESKEAPVDDPLQIAKYIREMEKTSDTFKVLCSAKPNQPNAKMIEEIVRFNYMKGYVLVPDPSSVGFNDWSEGADTLRMTNDEMVDAFEYLKELNNNILLFNEFTGLRGETKTLVGRLLRNDKSISDFINHMPKDLRILGIISDLFSSVSTLKFDQAVRLAKYGEYGYWTTAQNYDRETKTWSGFGSYHGVINDLIFQFEVEDKVIKRLYVKSIEELSKNSFFLIRAIKEFGFEADPYVGFRASTCFNLFTGSIEKKKHGRNVLFKEKKTMEMPAIAAPEEISAEISNGVLIVGAPKRNGERFFRLKFYPSRTRLTMNLPREGHSLFVSKIERVADLRSEHTGIMSWVDDWFSARTCEYPTLMTCLAAMKSMSDNAKISTSRGYNFINYLEEKEEQFIPWSSHSATPTLYKSKIQDQLEKLKKFLAVTISLRLKHKHLLTTLIDDKVDYAEQIEDNFDIFGEGNDFSKYLLEESGLFDPLEQTDEVDIVTDEIMKMTDLDDGLFDEVIVSKEQALEFQSEKRFMTRADVSEILPFWDELIEALYEEQSDSNLNLTSIFSSKYRQVVSLEFVAINTVLWLLSNDDKPPPPRTRRETRASKPASEKSKFFVVREDVEMTEEELKAQSSWGPSSIPARRNEREPSESGISIILEDNVDNNIEVAGDRFEEED